MTRLLIAAAVVVLAPAAFAACTGHPDQAMSCAEGHMWDEAAGTCLPIVVG